MRRPCINLACLPSFTKVLADYSIQASIIGWGCHSSLPAVPSDKLQGPCSLFVRGQSSQRSQSVLTDDPTFHRIAKGKDGFLHLRGEREQAENLGHMRSRDPQLAGELCPGRCLSCFHLLVPVLGYDQRVRVVAGPGLGLLVRPGQLEASGEGSVFYPVW